MTCEHCAKAVAEEVNDVLGTQGVEVDFATGQMIVTGEGFTDAAIKNAVEEAGYHVVEN
nr:heavy-metal-associated domain-containing protein [Corynebacterium epidermidicanis]